MKKEFSSLESGTEALAAEKIKQFSNMLNWGVQTLKKMIGYLASLRSETFELVTYSGLVAELISNKPDDSEIVKGAVIRKIIAPNRIELTVLYLDVNNEPVWGNDPKKPYGFIKRTKECDIELNSMFQDKDLIIFE